MKLIDIGVVGFGTGTEFCIAPYGTMRVGVEVETEFCRGKVLEFGHVYDEEPLLLIIQKCMRISKVVSIIYTVEYEQEGDENDLSDS